MNDEKWYSNVPVSEPVPPPTEDGQLGGFAWCESLGIVVGRGGKELLDSLRALREKR